MRLVYQNVYNRIIQYAYDNAGRLLTVTDTLGRVTKYDNAGRLLTVTDTLGRVTKNEYNAAGQLVKVTENYKSGQAQNYQNQYNRVTQYTYDNAGRLQDTIDTLGRITRTGYNGENQVAQVTVNYKNGVYDPAAPDEDRIIRYGYDANGNLTDVTDELNRVTHTFYDALNRVGQVIVNYKPGSALPDANLITTYSYDAAGNLQEAINPAGQITRYEYDALNRVVSVTENYVSGAGGTVDRNVITRDSYDGAGNLTGAIDADNHTTTYTYDEINRLKTIRDPLNYLSQYTYDSVGNLTSLTDAQNRTTQYSYDAANRLSGINYPDDTPDVGYSYDAAGRPVTMSDGLPTAAAWQYDAFDRVTSYQDCFNRTLNYQYDILGQRTRLTYPDAKAVNYAWDAAGRLKTVTDWSNQIYHYTWNGAGELTALARPAGLNSAWTYDGAGRLTGLSHRRGSALLAEYAYILDKSGNRTRLTEAWALLANPDPAGPHRVYLPMVMSNGGGGTPALPGHIIDYTYDALNRLIGANYSTGRNLGYSYDAVGNRTWETVNEQTTTYTYDAANRRNGFTYDANGNLLNDGQRTYAWDAANRLKTVTENGVTTQNDYTGQGDRRRQWVNGAETQYLLDPSGLAQVLAETTGGQTALYLPGLAQYAGNQWAYQLPDPLGSVRQLADAGGQILLAQQFDPYGKPLQRVTAGGRQSPFGYTGEQTGPAGLVFLRARYYDPATGRFLSKDPFPGLPAQPATRHPYQYGLNNPVRYTDPSGEYIESPLDVAFIIYDLASLAYNSYHYRQANNPCEREDYVHRMQIDTVALAIDLAFLALPGTGGGVWYRLAYAGGGHLAMEGTARAAIETGRIVQAGTKGVQLGGQAYLMSKPTSKTFGTPIETTINGKKVKLRVDAEPNGNKIQIQAGKGKQSIIDQRINPDKPLEPQIPEWLNLSKGKKQELLRYLQKAVDWLNE